VIVEDPDSPTPQPFIHWLVYNIPPDVTSLPENVPHDRELAQPPGARQGQNSKLRIGYTRPEPPPGDRPHRYHFQVYALDRMLPADDDLGRSAFHKAIAGHVLAKGELIGTYQR
jgi:Raf kinase inhibitor-like YbhB/YbcL family protein